MGIAGDVDLAALCALMSEPSRARVLLALGDGRALPAGALAAEAGVSAQAMSGHLGRLVDGGLLAVERSGRFRYYRLAGPEVAPHWRPCAASHRPSPSARCVRERGPGRCAGPAVATTTWRGSLPWR